MSTAPQGWQNPKTNWQAADIVHPSDFNRIEGNIQAIESGQRTLDPSQVPSGNTGSLRQMLDWFANRIRAITGATNWYDSPATTLAAAKSHMDATSGIHGATSSATANRLVIRDSAGRAQFADPNAAQDAATKAYVDSKTNVVVGQYTGNGQANRLISVGWRPRCVILFARVSHPDDGRYYDTKWEVWDAGFTIIRVRWALEGGNVYGPHFSLHGSSTLTIRDTGFSVWASSLTNVTGVTYHYIAFRN